MAVEIKFLDAIEPQDVDLIVDVAKTGKNYIRLRSRYKSDAINIWLDKPTAIKLKKQLGTLINQITLEEAKDDKG